MQFVSQPFSPPPPSSSRPTRPLFPCKRSEDYWLTGIIWIASYTDAVWARHAFLPSRSSMGRGMRDERKELLCIGQSHGRLLFPQSLVMFISLWLQRRLACLGLVKSILLGGKCSQKSLLSAFWNSHEKS